MRLRDDFNRIIGSSDYPPGIDRDEADEKKQEQDFQEVEDALSGVFYNLDKTSVSLPLAMEWVASYLSDQVMSGDRTAIDLLWTMVSSMGKGDRVELINQMSEWALSLDDSGREELIAVFWGKR